MLSLKKCSWFPFEVLLVFLIAVVIEHGESYRVRDDPWRRGATLDPPQGRYRLEWTVDQQLNRITFNVTVRTRGWLLLGFANDGGESTGQDVVIGGVRQNGRSYFSDRHTGRFNDRLQVDESQDYTLESYWGNGPFTFLSFSRALDTCDREDYPITENKITLIWAYGEQDDEDGMHTAQHGTYDIYLLDPEYTPQIFRSNDVDPVIRVSGRDSATTQAWSISKTTRMPTNDTSYLCSVHKAPRLPRKHHVIGFDVHFPDDQSRNHTHHVFLYRCRAPRGSSARDLFESVARSGQQQSCYQVIAPPVGDIPTHFCSNVIVEWTVGGREFFMPDHVGFPFGESADEYYLLQSHLDNPEMRSDLMVTINMDLFYTSRLRPNDGGILGVTSELPGLPEALLIPPQTPSMRLFGHCSAECTQRMLPESGITIAAARVHAHVSARKMRIHHFRNNKELPWISYDDNYNPSFQQFRPLRQGDVQVLPGDQLTMDCTFDTTWTNSTVTGGFQTRREMCNGWVLYYNLIPDVILCSSSQGSLEYRQKFLGVTNVTFYESQLDWVAQPPSPRHLVGRTITDISDNFVDWNKDLRNELQKFHIQHPHMGSCHRNTFVRDPAEIQQFLNTGSQTGELVLSGNVLPNVNTENDFIGPVNYPFSATPYTLPPTFCPSKRTLKRNG